MGDTLTLRANPKEQQIALHATLGDGTVCMEAEATIG